MQLMSSQTVRWYRKGALLGVAGMVAWGVAPSTASATDAAAATALPKTLTVFTQGDVNVQAEWQKVLIPQFEKAYPGEKIKLVFTTQGSENTDVYDQIAAAAKAGKMTSFDLVDGSVPAEAATANLLVKINAAEVPNINKVDPAEFKPVFNEAVPARGSQVLLAYNSSVVKSPPKTLSALLAWIKANPGKFTYNNPSDGGSGNGFVQDVVNAYAPPADTLKFDLGYYPKLETAWNKGFSVLKSIGPDIFGHTYPNSNTGTITLLASGAVDMGPVWSDMGTEALKDGQLPSTIKLSGIAPPMPGGPDYMGIPKNTPKPEQQLAFKFLNFLLQPNVQGDIVKVMDGTPGIEIKYLPAPYQKLFAGYPTPALPYSTQTGSDMEKDWASIVS
jgi:putative spermidine/putrescine transport system substrate-binding protein